MLSNHEAEPVPVVVNDPADPIVVEPVVPVDPVTPTVVEPVEPVVTPTEPVNPDNNNDNDDSDDDTAEVKHTWQGKEYTEYVRTNHSQGYVDEYFDEGGQCDSYMLIPGVRLMNTRFMAVVYFLTLIYLFLGISIIADIFMEAIEVVCSKVRLVEVRDKDRNTFHLEMPIWNPTVANLTLMALGSSAPEILLSIIDTVNTLGETPGELGVFSIVGSAAFNLLFITGICIISVGEDPKKIYDLGVFATTSLFSIWAYVWMYIALSGEGDQNGVIEIWEAWLTVFFFFLLCTMAYGADRYKAHVEDKKLDAAKIEEKNRTDEIKIKKGLLREFAKKFGDSTILQVGQGLSPKFDQEEKEHLSETEIREIRKLFGSLLGT
jgi:Ca2+/Na+ antiporter